MAHHKSAKKRIIQNEVKRLHNKYYARTTRNAVRDLKKLTDRDAATKRLPEVVSMLDKLAKTNVIHFILHSGTLVFYRNTLLLGRST